MMAERILGTLTASRTLNYLIGMLRLSSCLVWFGRVEVALYYFISHRGHAGSPHFGVVSNEDRAA